MSYDSGRYEMNPDIFTRCLRRPLRDNVFTCSQQSVFIAMDRFGKAVNKMYSTVLVPSRLLDIDMSDKNNEISRRLPANRDSTDLYSSFKMFKDVQNELLWGPALESDAPSRSSSGRSSPSNLRVMKYDRQLSDSCQKSDSDVDSVFTDKDSVDHQSSRSPENNISSAFRYHLLGLHTVLHELANSADFLTSMYQEETESSST